VACVRGSRALCLLPLLTFANTFPFGSLEGKTLLAFARGEVLVHLHLMGQALAEVGLPDNAGSVLRKFFDDAATFLINRES